MTLTDRQLRWREYRDDYLADNRGMFDSDEGRIADEAEEYADQMIADEDAECEQLTEVHGDPMLRRDAA